MKQVDKMFVASTKLMESLKDVAQNAHPDDQSEQINFFYGVLESTFASAVGAFLSSIDEKHRIDFLKSITNRVLKKPFNEKGIDFSVSIIEDNTKDKTSDFDSNDAISEIITKAYDAIDKQTDKQTTTKERINYQISMALSVSTSLFLSALKMGHCLGLKPDTLITDYVCHFLDAIKKGTKENGIKLDFDFDFEVETNRK